MPKVLTRLRIDEVSAVDRGAGDGVKIVLMKRASEPGATPRDTLAAFPNPERAAIVMGSPPTAWGQPMQCVLRQLIKLINACYAYATSPAADASAARCRGANSPSRPVAA